jgi:mono/diheme cytochrome c family protein
MMRGLRSGAAALAVVAAGALPAPPGRAADTPDKAKIEAGENVYSTYCAVCHGDNLVSTGQFPNLRRLTANDHPKFDTTVRNGRNQMPPWKDMLNDEQIDAIWAYIRAVVDR